MEGSQNPLLTCGLIDLIEKTLEIVGLSLFLYGSFLHLSQLSASRVRLATAEISTGRNNTPA